ncbi:MAG: TerB family tellurite resistance protein [Sphaerochaetaceae bacterium]
MKKWKGKIIGGAIGYFLGGPLGMIGGLALGNLFDATKSFSFTSRGPTEHQTKEMAFFIATFSMLAQMAIADGRLLPEEREVVSSFIDNDLKLSGEEKEIALRIFNVALTENIGFEAFANQFYENFSHDSSLLELMIDILVRVALADNRMSEGEKRLIYYSANLFRISEAHLKTIIDRYSGSSETLKKAYATLGLQEGATLEEAKKAYRKLSFDFHPDTIASKGLPEEFTVFATERFRAIQESFETIKNHL